MLISPALALSLEALCQKVFLLRISANSSSFLSVTAAAAADAGAANASSPFGVVVPVGGAEMEPFLPRGGTAVSPSIGGALPWKIFSTTV